MSKSLKRSIIAILVIIVLVVGGAFAFYTINTGAVANTETPQVFEVGDSESVKSVSARLEEEGIIKSAFFAELFVRFNGLNDLKAGLHNLDASWDLKTIFTQLNTPPKTADTVRITFQEGIWAREFADKIASETIVTREELLALWNDNSYLDELKSKYSFITDEMYNDSLNVKLEGYLFPETYDFYVKTTAKDVTEVLLNQTEKVYQKYKSEIESSKYSVHQIFTLASITQFEAGTDEENRLISGVWFNRLDIGMKLQSSVTVCYALYDDFAKGEWEKCEKYIDIDSPFNTYKYEGIPIGPISNPGESAIRSVLEPTASKYLYFMADVKANGGDGTVYFAETYEEHEQNVIKYLK